MPRKRRKFKLVETNKPNLMALPLRIGLNLPCMKGYYDKQDTDEDDSNLAEAVTNEKALRAATENQDTESV